MHRSKLTNSIPKTLAAFVATGGLAFAGVSAANAAELVDVELLPERSQLEGTLEAIETRRDYNRVYGKAKKLDVAPKRKATKRDLGPVALERKLKQLREDVREERKARKAERKAERAESGEATGAAADPAAVGVSSATLEAIAACESGGDPTAVSSSGAYRGKYQFDVGTWASVGGSGDPAAAPESEQDYRAALLYSRAGSSPWPVCAH